MILAEGGAPRKSTEVRFGSPITAPFPRLVTEAGSMRPEIAELLTLEPFTVVTEAGICKVPVLPGGVITLAVIAAL